jgi:hypothetical protein
VGNTRFHGTEHLGTIQHAHWMIMNHAWAVMADNKVPPTLWGECVLTSAYIKDRTPTCSLEEKTLYKAYYGRRPDVSHLWEIGCKAFVLVQLVHNPKIYSRSIECVLVSYSANSKVYQCYNCKTAHIINLRNVQFVNQRTPNLLRNAENASLPESTGALEWSGV